MTLPFFYFLQSHADGDGLIEQLQDAYDAADDGDATEWNALITGIVRELRSSSAVEAARREAEAFLDLACTNVANLPDSSYRQSLLDLCDFVVQRTY